MKRLFLFAAIGLAGTGAAAADVPTVALPVSQPAATPSKPKIICRSSPVTGSLVQQARRCGTAEDWARASENARNAADHLVTSQAAGIGTN